MQQWSVYIYVYLPIWISSSRYSLTATLINIKTNFRSNGNSTNLAAHDGRIKLTEQLTERLRKVQSLLPSVRCHSSCVPRIAFRANMYWDRAPLHTSTPCKQRWWSDPRRLLWRVLVVGILAPHRMCNMQYQTQ